jgi:Protein of unknown function (DUF1523)
MRVVTWVLGLLVLAVVGLFLHYVLPKHAVVYVTSTENRIVSPDEVRGFRSFGEQAAATNPQGQVVVDVFFINAIKRDGGPLVFRNEDTGFGFPWYLKFDSANLQAEAQDAVSTRDDPEWMVVRYYGWRIPFMSMFPNAVSMEPAASRDIRVIPWFNTIFLILLVAVVWAIWARIRRWRQRRRDPVAASWETPPTRRGWFGR